MFISTHIDFIDMHECEYGFYAFQENHQASADTQLSQNVGLVQGLSVLSYLLS